MQKHVDHSAVVDLEYILEEVGDFGRYQILVFIYLGITIIFTAINNCQYIFAAGKVGYRCRVPECESTPEEYDTKDWGKFALPSKGHECHRFVPIGKECVPGSFSNNLKRCHAWVYENKLTIVPEFDLACQEWKRTLVGTVHNVGVFLAIPLTAFVSDHFGRKVALIATASAPGIFGVARAYCSNYIIYLILECLEALVGAGTYSAAFILGLEMLSVKRRVLGGNLLSCIFALGQVVCAGCAYAFPYWRWFLIVIFVPNFFLALLWFVVEESVRWLLTRERKTDAARIIYKVARMNKKKLSQKSLKMLQDEAKPVSDPSHSMWSTFIPAIQQRLTAPESVKKKSLCIQVIKSRTILFRLSVCSFWWITVTMIYYGISINSVALAGNMYVNYTLASLMEIPGCFLSSITLNRFGRKSSIITGFFLCGTALIVQAVCKNKVISMTLTLVGKMMISMIFCSIYIYTVELFPTSVRHTLMGVCSMTGRIGSMLAPQTPLLMDISESLPYMVFGSMAGMAGLLMLLTPETLHQKLPDTIQEAERMEIVPRSNRTTDIIVEKTSYLEWPKRGAPKT